MSSIYDGSLKLSIFGQSHSAAIGVTIDGLPAGEAVDFDRLQAFLSRRAPGGRPWASARREADAPEFLCGLVNGVSCGAPITAVIRNADAHSKDYEALRDVPRPGHADYPAQLRYGGWQDVSGGGHFSGRLTAPLCVAGGIALQLLERRGVSVGAHLLSVADAEDIPYDPLCANAEALACAGRKPFPALSDAAGEAMQTAIREAAAEGDSVGGVIECAAAGVPAGLGEALFDGMENRIARLAFAVPAVKGIEFGAGFESARLRGSQNNDPYRMREGKVVALSNRAGGILGGITTGMPLIFRAAIKPTPSIARPQMSVSLSRGEDTVLQVRGRHDPCIAPRAVPCMEAVLAIALLDAMLERHEVKL